MPSCPSVSIQFPVCDRCKEIIMCQCFEYDEKRFCSEICLDSYKTVKYDQKKKPC